MTGETFSDGKGHVSRQQRSGLDYHESFKMRSAQLPRTPLTRT